MRANSLQSSRYVIHSLVFVSVTTYVTRSPQLIPGHEAIGKVIEKGKNVKDFDIGDRIVADVGISVRSFVRVLSRHAPTLIGGSATTVSTAGAATPSCARTSMLAVLPSMVVSQNTSCTTSASATRSTTLRTRSQHYLSLQHAQFTVSTSSTLQLALTSSCSEPARPVSSLLSSSS